MRTADFDFQLPPELIASRPPERRGDSRMLVVDRASGTIEHAHFSEFFDRVPDDQLLVFNDARVVPARFYCNDGRTELLRLDVLADGRWKCMGRPGKRLRLGSEVAIGEATGRVEEIWQDRNGERIVAFDREVDIDAHGHLALPPYMGRSDEALDRERYQTVYAKNEGAIAAPTAGLHFTPQMMAGRDAAFVTLHVGAGTFQPVKAEVVTEHRMHSENFEISPECAGKLADSERVTAIGTTVVRVLEHCAASEQGLVAQRGETRIFIYPPYQFRAIGSLLTNFHLPCSTLLMLVSAFAGRELILEAYAKAVENRYRFYSYGDCMLIL